MTDVNSAGASRTTRVGETPLDDPEARVDQLTNEIDETREDLSETIEAIGDKLDPGNIAREASQTVRSATVGKVEQMTYGAQETWRDVRTGDTGSIVDTITSNPIPAGMVALGLGMLFMNRGKRSQFRGYENRQRPWESSEWDRPSGERSAADRLGETVAGAGERFGEVADEAGRMVGEVPQQAGRYVEQGGSQISRFIDENPLGAGVIAVAAGAALGMLLPTTPLERDAIGPARDQFVDKVEGTVHQALDNVEQQVGAAQAKTSQSVDATA